MKLEEDAMQRKAWRDSQNIVIDGESSPCSRGLYGSICNQYQRRSVFFDSKLNLQTYNLSKSTKMRNKVPGHNYTFQNFIASARKLSKVVK